MAKYLARPDTTVIAAVRKPDGEDAKALNDVMKGERSQLFFVKIDSASETDAAAAVKALRVGGRIVLRIGGRDVCME